MKVLSSPTANDRRQDTITHIFEQCCRDGLLSSRFVRTLSNGPFHDDGWTEDESERVCKELFGRDHPSFPSAWSRNLKDKKAQPTADWEMKNNNRTGSFANKDKTDVTIEKKGGGFSELFHRKKDKSPT